MWCVILTLLHFFYSRWRSWCGKSSWMLLISVFIGIPVVLYWVTCLLVSFRYMREILHMKERLLLVSFLYWCRIYWIWSFKSNRSLWFHALLIRIHVQPTKAVLWNSLFYFWRENMFKKFFPMDWPANEIHSSTRKQSILVVHLLLRE